jgi:hypothetical protein
MKKKFTRKQRREIYLKAAIMIEKGDSYLCCFALSAVIGRYIGPMRELMPELYMFEPHNPGFGWFNSWDGFQNPTEARIITLLLCAEMTKDK